MINFQILITKTTKVLGSSVPGYLLAKVGTYPQQSTQQSKDWKRSCQECNTLVHWPQNRELWLRRKLGYLAKTNHFLTWRIFHLPSNVTFVEISF